MEVPYRRRHLTTNPWSGKFSGAYGDGARVVEPPLDKDTPKWAALYGNLNGKALVEGVEANAAFDGQGWNVIRLAEVWTRSGHRLGVLRTTHARRASASRMGASPGHALAVHSSLAISVICAGKTRPTSCWPTCSEDRTRPHAFKLWDGSDRCHMIVSGASCTIAFRTNP